MCKQEEREKKKNETINKIKLDSIGDFFRMQGQMMFNRNVIKHMTFQAISWIPIYYFFKKLYYPFIYKQFIKVTLKDNPNIIKKSIKIPAFGKRGIGIPLMRLYSTLHAIFVVITRINAWIKQKYKMRDILNACYFDYPPQLNKAADISLAYFIIDLIPTLYNDPKNFTAVAHHLLTASFLAIEKYLNIGGPGDICIFLPAEFTTIFLHPAWFLRDIVAKFDIFMLINKDIIKKGNKNYAMIKFKSIIQKYANIFGVLFALLFLYCRWRWHIYMSPFVIKHMYNVQKIHNGKINFPKIARIHGITCTALFQLVNFVWSYALIKVMIQLITKKGVKLDEKFSN